MGFNPIKTEMYFNHNAPGFDIVQFHSMEGTREFIGKRAGS